MPTATCYAISAETGYKYNQAGGAWTNYLNGQTYIGQTTDKGGASYLYVPCWGFTGFPFNTYSVIQSATFTAYCGYGDSSAFQIFEGLYHPANSTDPSTVGAALGTLIRQNTAQTITIPNSVIQGWVNSTARRGYGFRSSVPPPAIVGAQLASNPGATDYLTITYTTNSPPTAPTNLTPHQNASSPVPVSWQHNDPQLDAQNRRQLRWRERAV